MLLTGTSTQTQAQRNTEAPSRSTQVMETVRAKLCNRNTTLVVKIDRTSIKEDLEELRVVLVSIKALTSSSDVALVVTEVAPLEDSVLR